MKAIIKSILVLSFLIFSTSSFAQNGCSAIGISGQDILIPKEGYAKYGDVQPFLSEDNVNRIAETATEGVKKKALEDLQDQKNKKEESLRSLCPKGFETEIEWSNEKEYIAYGVRVEVKGNTSQCHEHYSDGGSLEELEECLMDRNDVGAYDLPFLDVRAFIEIIVQYTAYCEVKCVPNEN